MRIGNRKAFLLAVYRTSKILLVRCGKCIVMSASSYFELPKKYNNAKSNNNIQNDDVFCFLWCILAGRFRVHETDKLTETKQSNKLL